MSFRDATRWLEERGCLDGYDRVTLSEDAILRRCRALQTVRFGSQVSLAQQNRFLQRVTPLCHMFAV